MHLMSKHHARVALAILAPLFSSAGSVHAQTTPAGKATSGAITPEQLPLTGQLGSDTCSYLYRMGWDELRARLKGTAALEAIENLNVQTFFQEMIRLGDRNDAHGAFYKLALAGLHQDVVMATLDFGSAGAAAAPKTAKTPAEIEKEEEQGKQKAAAPSRYGQFAVVTPGAESGAGFGPLFEQAFENWPDSLTRTELEGLEWVVLGDQQDGMYAGHKENRYYWAVGRRTAERAMKLDQPEKLGKSPLFEQAVGPLLAGQTERPIAMYYYDLRSDWDETSGTPAGAIWSQMSWRSLDAVAGATFVQGKGFRNRHYWKIGSQRTGLFRNTETLRINQEWLKRVPADATGFTTGVFDANSFVLTMMMAGVRTFGAGDEAAAGLGAMTMPLQPMLKLIGSRYLVYRLPGRYGNFLLEAPMPTANLVMIVELNDAEAFKQALDGLLGMIPGNFARSFKLQGRDVRGVNAIYFNMSVAILEKEAVLTTSTQLLKDALENLDKPGPSIVDTPAFKAAQKHAQPNACFMMYFAPGGFARGIYDHYIPQLQQVIPMFQFVTSMFDSGRRAPSDASAEGLRHQLLPRGADLTHGVTEATILTAQDDGKGILFDGYAPLLSTPYYWVYVHALTRLQPAGLGGLQYTLGWMLKPVQPHGDEDRDRPNPAPKEQ